MDREKPFTKIEDLNKYYENFVTGTLNQSKFKLVSKNSNKIGDLNGYRIVLANPKGNTIYTAQIFIINFYIYNFIYINKKDFSKKDSELFLNSIELNNKTTIVQF